MRQSHATNDGSNPPQTQPPGTLKDRSHGRDRTKQHWTKLMVQVKVNAYSSYATSLIAIWELTCHMGSHSVTCHLTEVTFPPLLQPVKVCTPFSAPGEIQGCVYLVGLITYRGGIPAWRRSPIPVLTALTIEQLLSCLERRYSYAKPYSCLNRK